MTGFVEKAKTFTLHLLGYLAGGLFMLAGIVSVMDDLLLAAGAFLLGVVLIPRVPLPAMGRGASAVVLLLLMGLGAGRAASRDARLEKAAADASRVAIEAAAKDAAIARFAGEGEAVLDGMRAALADRDHAKALQLAGPFRNVDNGELRKLVAEAEAQRAEFMTKSREESLVVQVRAVPASDLDENRRLYAELTELRPDVPRYQERLEYYSDRIQEQRRAAEERIQRFGPMPEKSGWDGTYRVVRDYLRDIANDPSSIEMIACTAVFHTGNGWLVGCDYRAKNAFGGLIRASHWFTIRQNAVVRMEDADAYRNR